MSGVDVEEVAKDEANVQTVVGRDVNEFLNASRDFAVAFRELGLCMVNIIGYIWCIGRCFG